MGLALSITEKGDAEFHAYFYHNREVKQEKGDIPMRPAALTNMPLIDEAWQYCRELLGSDVERRAPSPAL